MWSFFIFLREYVFFDVLQCIDKFSYTARLVAAFLANVLELIFRIWPGRETGWHLVVQRFVRRVGRCLVCS